MIMIVDVFCLLNLKMRILDNADESTGIGPMEGELSQ